MTGKPGETGNRDSLDCRADGAGDVLKGLKTRYLRDCSRSRGDGPINNCFRVSHCNHASCDDCWLVLKAAIEAVPFLRLSRFLCEKFPGVLGVFDRAGPNGDLRYRPRPCCLPLQSTASAPRTSYFTALYRARPCLYQRFTRDVATVGA